MNPWKSAFQNFLCAVVFVPSLFLCSGYAAQEELGHSFNFKGVNYTAWAAEEYATPASDASLSLLKTIGANWVAILVTEYMDTKSATEIYADKVLTPSESSLIHVVQMAHSQGLNVMLKLHVDPKDGTWRGEIFPANIEAWFENYQGRVLHYIKLAESLGVELFCLGTELRSLSGKAFRDYWERLISAVREIFTGPLVYAANWDEFQTVSFWDLLDYVGIDAYFPLSYTKTPSVEELLLAWVPWISLIETWQREVGKLVIFTEVGYRSIDYAAREPWNWTINGSYNPQAQANCYHAVFRAFWGRPWFAGLFFWNWQTNPAAGGPGDLGYTPQNKPAQEILRKFCGGEENPSSENLKKVTSCFWGASEGGKKRGEFCPVYERREVVHWEQSFLGKAAQSEFQNAKEV